MPTTVGVILIEQEPLASVQVPPGVKVTIPVGVLAVPGEVSVTLAVHDVDWPTTTVEGAQATEVLVARLLTLTLGFQSILPRLAVVPLCNFVKVPPE